MLGLAVAGIALEIFMHLIPHRWLEVNKQAAEFGLSLGFVPLGTAGVTLLD
jgi:hypothetical protein